MQLPIRGQAGNRRPEGMVHFRMECLGRRPHYVTRTGSSQIFEEPVPGARIALPAPPRRFFCVLEQSPRNRTGAS